MGDVQGWRDRTWQEGHATDLVGGDDPLARVLEQLLIPPVRVLEGQPLCAQIVVAEPEQAQRLQERLAVPSLCPEGCMPRGHAERRKSGGVTKRSPRSLAPSPPSGEPWARPERLTPTNGQPGPAASPYSP